MLALFAQQPNFGPAGGGGNPPPDPAALIGLLAFYALLFAVGLGVQIAFLLSLSNCLKQISRRNRQMEPGQVWLCLIPLFGIVWLILTVIRLGDSLRDEYDDRRLRGDGDFGKTYGLIYVISAFVCGCVTPIFLILYWVKIAGYTRQLTDTAGRRGRDDDDRYDDDRPSRRRRRDESDDDRDDRDDRGRAEYDR